ncbi:hypothetical protein L1987_75844 [Smallanthus sonchifolius]|uniref:Uncharacterized protein n=1 Tax=Smallanthus sonchifolius TaxID=185202 RepID=A0ACB9A6P4_9ASTR|nr:hypothetical protein L1987_75844 [Smallanthus sonchifolius]
MTGSSGSSCGACKFLRRKCTSKCDFSPYFCYPQGADHFSAVHKVFGASNVSKLLMKVPLQNRSDAAISICYEALARMQDPIYGCVAQIFALEQQVASLQEEIDQLATYMAYDLFYLPNHESLQETNNMNTALPISFQFNDALIGDYINYQQTPMSFAASQATCFLGDFTVQNAHYYSFLDHLVMENDCNILNT